jgi:hypothetical protein
MRRYDELVRQRQRLPWVPVNKTYRFETTRGARTLEELFNGRSQLLLYHFMFGPEYTVGCPACSAIAASSSSGFVSARPPGVPSGWRVGTSRPSIGRVQPIRSNETGLKTCQPFGAANSSWAVRSSASRRVPLIQ